MRYTKLLVVCCILSVLFLALVSGRHHKKPKPSKPKPKPKPKTKSHKCVVTKGSGLTTFMKARGKILLPCRYILSEFFCHLRTKVIAESSMGRDGVTFVSGVTVRKSRTVSKGHGGMKEDFDEASIDLEDFEKFIEDGDFKAAHWDSMGDANFWQGDSKKRLHGMYDAGKKRTMLSDNSSVIQVSFDYVDKDIEKGSAGFLAVVCTDPKFGGVLNSTGFLCGNAGTALNPADNKKHLQNAAGKVKLSVNDYLTYTILVEQDVDQTDSMCEEASDLTRDCFDPKEAVSMCGLYLDRKTYSGKCFSQGKVNPLQAYINCIKWRCKNQFGACLALGNMLEDCGRKKKLLKSLTCMKKTPSNSY